MRPDGEKIRQILEPAYLKLFLIPRALRNQKRLVKDIRRRQNARVVFIVSSLPMWRAGKVFDLLRQDSRFNVSLALYPYPTFEESQKAEAMADLTGFCQANQIRFLDLSREAAPGRKLREALDPDILFYPQPYNRLFGNDLDCTNFQDKLLCYIPYSIYMTNAPWVYKTLFNNLAWRLYYGSGYSRSYAADILYNRGRNIRVVGEPMADFFDEPAAVSAWKAQDKPKKKVIWAPHFSIVDEGWHHRDSFTWVSDTMRDLAGRYKDSLQFAFKPHPRLFSVLASLPDWGEEKAAAYYRQWEEGENTQLETGPYVDLFKESDAMIHDCGSFSVEYHLTGKPAMFLARDIDSVVKDKNEVGRKGILAHYVGTSGQDIESFLEKVVLGGDDPMKEERERFKAQYLAPPAGTTVAGTIYQDILKGLKFQ